jgi:hypothetical protein
VTSRRLATGGIAVLILLLLGGCGVAAAVSRLPAGEHPDVDFRSAEISTARAAVVPQLEAELDAVESRFGAMRVGDRIRIDTCQRGFDDFTRSDRYAYSCRMELVAPVPVREPFRQEASRLGEALLEGDCLDGTDTDRALAEPFDRPRQLRGSRGDCVPGTSVPGPEIRQWLAVPPATGEAEVAQSILRPSCFREFCEVSPIDLGAAAEAAPPGTAALALVRVVETYYLVAWDCPWPASWFRDTCTDDSHSPVRASSSS